MKASGVVGFLSLIMVAGQAAGQGKLAPPGAPLPSMKTLQQVEPRTPIDSLPVAIESSGSYYLVSNLVTRVALPEGISIQADHVTLDLNGFRIDGIHAISNGLSGIYLEQGDLRNCRASGNGDRGISGGAHCTAADCIASGNVSDGIRLGAECNVTGCRANLNGINGIRVSAGSVVISCEVAQNGNHGISTAIGCTVVQSSARDNGDVGIQVNSGCNVNHCSSVQNGGDGIQATIGTHVESSTAYSNAGDGIEVGTDCVVLNNTLKNNGSGTHDAAGVHAQLTRNRNDGNHCTGADRGIQAGLGSNFIVRNTCSGNTTNYSIANFNDIAEIIVDPGSNFTANAWSNFEF